MGEQLIHGLFELGMMEKLEKVRVFWGSTIVMEMVRVGATPEQCFRMLRIRKSQASLTEENHLQLLSGISRMTHEPDFSFCFFWSMGTPSASPLVRNGSAERSNFAQTI